MQLLMDGRTDSKPPKQQQAISNKICQLRGGGVEMEKEDNDLKSSYPLYESCFLSRKTIKELNQREGLQPGYKQP